MSTEYENVRSTCLETGELWTDPDFPANNSSLFRHGKNQLNIVWKRPKELVINPEFIVDTQAFDILPGKLGDNWFVQCLRCLYSSKGLLYRAVPADQGFLDQDEYCGVFRFRVWWCGVWKEVLVDDRLPTVGNRLVFLSSHRLSSFWAALLEKAYAKLHGSYDSLKYGSVLEGLADLTGGVVETLPLRDDPTLTGRLLLSLLDMSSLVTCTVQVENNNKMAGHNDRLANGINVGTNYRLLSIDKVSTIIGEMVQLVHLDSGDSNAYLGTWGPTSPTWEEVGIEERGRLGVNQADQGEFWMSYTDFMRTFTHLEMVHLDSETARDEPTMAGRNYVDTFHLNPQLQVVMNQSEPVILSLSQHSVTHPQVIGFTGYPQPPNSDSLGRSFFKSARSLLNSQYTNSRHVSLRTTLSSCSYLVLPTTFEPSQESSFTFRVLSRSQTKLRAVDCTPALLRSPVLKAPAHLKESKGYEQYESLFMQLCDERRTVSAFELQELLETCLPNDYIKSMASIDVCRQIVSTLEKDKNSLGRLSHSNFKDLIVSLKMWQGVFRAHTKEKTGVLRAERLRDALLEVGFRTSNEILGQILLRYLRKDGTLRFGDFVSIILILNTAFGYAERKDPSKNGFTKLSTAELVRAMISC
ncbi:calpain-C [Eurytemora carolleeae]|uniref:calpain-C n=1 Tax=Eurytemora carolleeae TaxID=1294199 RepID=UPI000C774189|nr:calpain-C [Eurytemora carolleeae]XP_023329733.1 calpain-C [Eurytemora carolleeae]|eukprot:XP_023329732.1 calpain-C-like [Eurytemora affinis]